MKMLKVTIKKEKSLFPAGDE